MVHYSSFKPDTSNGEMSTNTTFQVEETVGSLSKYLPLLILPFIFLFILIFVIACRRRSVKQKRRKVIVEQKQKELESKLNLATEGQPDLLDTTVRLQYFP